MKKIIQSVMMGLLLLVVSSCASAPYVKGLRPQTQNLEKNHNESRFMGVDNTSLFWQSWTAEKSKAVVIFVHGLKDHSDRYSEVARKLNSNAYSVYSFDLRGHGESEGQRVWVDHFQDYISDLELFYDLVKKQEPHKPIFIFGHSMGGAIVTEFALKNSRPVAGLILSAPALKVGEDINGFLIFMTHILGHITPTLAVMNLKNESFSKDPSVVKAIVNDPLVYQKNGPAHTANELINTISDIQDKMPELKTPFITLHGDKDLLTNPDGSRELFEKSSSLDKTIKIYPGLYHDLLHEPEKEIVYQDLLAWLKARTAK